MKRLGICGALVWALASLNSAQVSVPGPAGPSTPARRPAVAPAQTPVPQATGATPTAAPPQTFQKYCFECHSGDTPEAHLGLDRLVTETSKSAVGVHSEQWEKVAQMLETGEMPPLDASDFPSDAERAATASWIRSSIKAYETAHAGDPGRVTVRRLTSAEYAYAIRDLTGVDVKTGIDASSDSVGGEGFTNFGDVQFVQDASIERYLEGAKLVADHAVIGAGPLEFYADPGKTGLELSALNRINELYASKGFRLVSGEGGRPYGLERYGKAFYVAWHYKHRAALGDPAATLRGLAAKEGITGRFADHVWSVLNQPNLSYPTRDFVETWKKLPAPNGDAGGSIARARSGCDELYKTVTTWASWFFARGDLAAGGAGDESPLSFDDATLRVVAARPYTFALGGGGRGGGRGRGAPAPTGPPAVHISMTSVNQSAGVTPVVIWRNARIVTRAAGAGGGRGFPGGAAGAAGGARVGGAAASPAPTTPARVTPVGVTPQAVAAPAGASVAGAAAIPAVPTGGGRRGGGAPALATAPLASMLPADIKAQLAFGTSPDGTEMGPNDFATTGSVSFTLPVPAAGTTFEFQAEAELGADKNAVVRLMLSDRPNGPNSATQRVVLGHDKSVGYTAYRAAIAEYAALLPPNSHGEANPADKDPVPAPFDNTYNSPEHDAFVNFVKYQRRDAFFTANLVDGADRDRLNQAWNDLFGSWPYHDAYFGMLIDHFKLTVPSRKIADMSPARIAALPANARGYVGDLRKHYDEVMRAQRLAQPGHIDDALAFAGRAWRRPLTTAEKTGLRAFYQKSRTANGLDHDAAVRALVSRILVSPAFLYRVETVARGPERPLDNHELASRLSFFLWSSVPDDELRRAATAGELTRTANLERQVRRMTADPKARRLATEFFGQWLGFYHFDQYRGVDTGRFPEFTEEVKAAMYDEAISTFEYIVREQRPIREVLHADYAFLNKPLAKFYGIDRPVTSTDRVERVDGAGSFDRGGALRLGSVLTTTSAPLRTSPVKRGDWVLRRILGTPTPPPPADAGSIPADDKTFEGQTLRQRLDMHKRNATCANCHLRIDPLGFPLEAYDAVGRTRQTYADGKPVDVTGEFADKSTIAGARGLLDYLKSRDPQVMTTMSKKMIGYALGRTVMASDRPLVDAMTSAGGDASFADLAVKIVSSRQFRNRAGDEPAASSRAAIR